jgi:hypothetical protein
MPTAGIRRCGAGGRSVGRAVRRPGRRLRRHPGRGLPDGQRVDPVIDRRRTAPGHGLAPRRRLDDGLRQLPHVRRCRPRPPGRRGGGRRQSPARRAGLPVSRRGRRGGAGRLGVLGGAGPGRRPGVGARQHRRIRRRSRQRHDLRGVGRRRQGQRAARHAGGGRPVSPGDRPERPDAPGRREGKGRRHHPGRPRRARGQHRRGAADGARRPAGEGPDEGAGRPPGRVRDGPRAGAGGRWPRSAGPPVRSRGGTDRSLRAAADRHHPRRDDALHRRHPRPVDADRGGAARRRHDDERRGLRRAPRGLPPHPARLHPARTPQRPHDRQVPGGIDPPGRAEDGRRRRGSVHVPLRFHDAGARRPARITPRTGAGLRLRQPRQDPLPRRAARGAGAGRAGERGLAGLRPHRRPQPPRPAGVAYDTGRRATMLFDVDCRVADDPDAEERLAWDGRLGGL